jgi:hypothetical protein
MSYDPQDHTPSPKQVVAAWAICLAIVGSALGLTVLHHNIVPDAVADPTKADMTANSAPLAGVHIPEFAICQAEPNPHSTACDPRKHGSMSAPAGQC